MNPCTRCSVPGFNHPVDGFLHQPTLSAFCEMPAHTDDPNYTRHWVKLGDGGVGETGERFFAAADILRTRTTYEPLIPLKEK